MLGILQHASDCTICGAYVTHFMESHLMENTSFIDAVHHQDSEFVSFTMYCDTILDKEHAQEDTAHYRTSSDKFEAEVNDLRQHVFKLKDEIKMAKKALENMGLHTPKSCRRARSRRGHPQCPNLLIRR